MKKSKGTELLNYLSVLTLVDLPADVVTQAKVCLLDALGCGLFGSDREWVRILREEMANEGAPGRATVFGQPALFAAPAAALCNGTAIHSFELDDLISASVVHPAATAIPAALAAGEATDASGERVLTGIVAGYEVMHRVALAIGTNPARRGFHTTSLTAPIAAAVAAGVTMGLAPAQIVSAVGLAASSASGIKSFAAGFGGGMVKRLHLGRSAEAGVRMCQLAARGFAGPPRAIDSRFGMIEVFGGEDSDPARLTEGLGRDWAVRDVWFKGFPICGWIHSVVQLVLAQRGDAPVQPEDVTAVTVGVSSYAAGNNGEPAPIDTMGAQYSIPYCVAIAFLGDPRDPRMFQGDNLNRRDILDLASRVEIVVDPEIEAVYPSQFGARVRTTLAGIGTQEGKVLDCHGTPADPPTVEEQAEKFRTLSTDILSPSASDDLVAAVNRLETLSSIGDLTRLLRTSEPAAAAAVRAKTADTTLS